ncbi:DUF5103 domain-containing protein [Marinilabiliaceae bacterium JC017]|nr:DUF5103 domain-containing protein [Marinilabiliaceae bacterium JC017]
MKIPFKHLFSFLIIFLIIPFQTYSKEAPGSYQQAYIKTVQLHKKDWPLSYPIINIRAKEQLQLSFDDFSTESRNYYYTVTHCNASWEESDLMETDFMSGFTSNPLDDYQFSFNTTFDYTHYNLFFPNDNMQLLLSGNYIIKVYEDNDRDNPVLTRPFMVYEPLVNIVPQIKYSVNSSLRKAMQEVDFTIHHPNFTITNPIEEIKVVVQQNGRIDNQITDLKPLFIRPGELVYDYNRENLFEGGNEFRWLDIRSTRFAPEYVENIEFHPPHYHFALFPDQHRNDKSYFYKEDFNGRYYIETREKRDHEIEADYVFVHFSLPVKQPFLDGAVYINGAITNWQLNEKTQMTYNPQNMSYEKTLLLKQGFYNYQLLFKSLNTKKGKLQRIEGSFGQTENDYLILVYYSGFGDYYDRLIGVTTANSLKYNISQ